MSDLIPITEDSHEVLLDIRYASDNNLTHAPIYQQALCFLHYEAEEKLRTAIQLAKAQGLTLKIFDAYRPKAAQLALWNAAPNPEFVSHPEHGAVPHCRGIAIDLTLVDDTQKELDMGTGFDDFTPQAFHGDTTISEEAQKNRYLLLGIMMSAGWDFYRNEWWHYQLFAPRNYPIIHSDQTMMMG